jgi:hypothetical protein
MTRSSEEIEVHESNIDDDGRIFRAQLIALPYLYVYSVSFENLLW